MYSDEHMYTIVTHSGSFHADDVFSIAAFQMLLGIENTTFNRTRDEAVIAAADYVVDVGGVYNHVTKRYDHHQPGAPVRENGIPYAGFGLMWRHYGQEITGSTDTANYIEEHLCQPIDAGDNGVTLYELNDYQVKPFELYNFVSLYNPPWGSTESRDEQFIKAAERQNQLIAAVYEAASDKTLLEFTVPVSMMAVVQYPDVHVIVCPDDPATNDNWTATCVRKDFNTFASRVSFPESWAGLRSAELAAQSGLADAVFCHKARFLFVGGSKQSALAAAQQAT